MPHPWKRRGSARPIAGGARWRAHRRSIVHAAKRPRRAGSVAASAGAGAMVAERVGAPIVHAANAPAGYGLGRLHGRRRDGGRAPGASIAPDVALTAAMAAIAAMSGDGASAQALLEAALQGMTGVVPQHVGLPRR